MHLDLDVGKATNIETATDVHDISFRAEERNCGVGANKSGRNITCFDFQAGVIDKVHEVPGRYFLLGHMVYSDDGRFLVATAVDTTRPKTHASKNSLLVLNPLNFEIEKIISLPYCEIPQHDCRFLPNSHTLVTTGGHEIAHVDVASGIVRAATVPNLASKTVIRHFGLHESGRLAVQANAISDFNTPEWKYGDGQIVLAELTPERERRIQIPDRLRSEFDREILDLCFEPSGTFFAVSLNRGHEVTFWNFARGEMIAVIKFEDEVRRIASSRDGEHFVVVTGRGLRYVSTANFTHDSSLDQFDEIFAETFQPEPYWAHARII